MANRNLAPYVLGGIFALAVAAVSSPAVGLAQSATASMRKAIQEVIVANDTARPVPVQTQGTSQVIVANDTLHALPVQTLGTSDVNVLNVVPVQLQGTPDVNVVNVQTVTAVQKTAFGTFQSGSRFSDRVVLYTVPAGKRLIIESVSIASNLAGPDQHLIHVLFEADNGDVVPYTITVQPVAEGLFSSTGANIFRATQQVTAYAAAGTEVAARGTRDGTDIAHLDSLMMAFAGRLVDAP